MVEAARRAAAGEAAIGTGPGRVPHVKLRSFEGIVPKACDWKTLAVSADEQAGASQAHAAD